MATYYPRPLAASDFSSLQNLTFTYDSKRLVTFVSRPLPYNTSRTEYRADMFDRERGLPMQYVTEHPGAEPTWDESVPDPAMFDDATTWDPPSKSIMMPWKNDSGWSLIYMATYEEYELPWLSNGKSVWMVYDSDEYEKSDLAKAVPNLNEILSLGGTLKVTLSADGRARVINVKTGAVVQELVDPKGAIASISISPDEQHVATGTKDGSVIIWDQSGDHQTDLKLRMKRDIAEVYPEVYTIPDDKALQNIDNLAYDLSNYSRQNPEMGDDMYILRPHGSLGTDDFLFAVFRDFTGERDVEKTVRHLLRYSYLGIALLAYDPSSSMENKIERAINRYQVLLKKSRHDRFGQDGQTGNEFSDVKVPLSIEDAYGTPYKAGVMAKARSRFVQYDIGAKGFQMPRPDPETSPALASDPVVVDRTFQRTHELSMLAGQAYLLKPLATRLSHLAEVDIAKAHYEARQRITQADKVAKHLWVASCKQLDCPLDPLDPNSKAIIPGAGLDAANGADISDSDAAYYAKDISRTWPDGTVGYINGWNRQEREDREQEKKALNEYMALLTEYKDDDLDVSHILEALDDVKKQFSI